MPTLHSGHRFHQNTVGTEAPLVSGMQAPTLLLITGTVAGTIKYGIALTFELLNLEPLNL